MEHEIIRGRFAALAHTHSKAVVSPIIRSVLDAYGYASVGHVPVHKLNDLYASVKARLA